MTPSIDYRHTLKVLRVSSVPDHINKANIAVKQYYSKAGQMRFLISQCIAKLCLRCVLYSVISENSVYALIKINYCLKMLTNTYVFSEY